MDQSSIVKTLENEPLLNDTVPKHKSKVGTLVLRIGLILGVFLIVVGILSYLFVARPAIALLASVQELELTAKAVSPYIKNQDLAGAKAQLDKVKSQLALVQSQYSGFSWAKSVPIASNYYSDGLNGMSAGQDLLDAGQITIAAIAPYADVIGLKGITGGGGELGKTAEDKINFVVNTLSKISPQMDQIGAKLKTAQISLDKIDPNRYPDEVRGIKLKSQLSTGIQTVNLASEVINDAKPLIDSAPYILGIDSPRKYLLLFQNDAEIRPTGGFLTGYAIISVNKGKISALQSDDIYKLDELFPKKITAPTPILKYLPLVPYWYLRDMNLSPDFRTSMETFLPNYKLTKSPEVDGIIAVNTQVLVDLLKITGSIGASGLGNFSAEIDPRCNCPQVFYELQVLAGGEEPVIWDSVSNKIIKAPANYGNRKAFLGPLMYSILANVMAQPKSKMPELFNTAINQITSKNVLTYFVDPQVQDAAEKFNMAGRVRNADQDYLLIVDTNFAGAKTNIWVNYKADQKVDISGDGTVTKTLTLTYSNPQQKAVKITQARNLNGQFRDWLRVYVPKGSKIIESKGFESGDATSEDLEKTVFEGFFSLSPGNTRQIVLKYTLPTKIKSPYKLLIQKQGGTRVFPYTISINGKAKPEVLLNSDQELEFNY